MSERSDGWRVVNAQIVCTCVVCGDAPATPRPTLAKGNARAPNLCDAHARFLIGGEATMPCAVCEAPGSPRVIIRNRKRVQVDLCNACNARYQGGELLGTFLTSLVRAMLK